jgi:hypothetical protein
MSPYKKSILSFYEFINESADYVFAVDQRFPWSGKINEVIDKIMTKRKYLVNNFNYNKHGGNGFEFNIKAKTFPDPDDLSKKYGYTESEIWDLWHMFLNDNLEMSGEDFVENSGHFNDWFTTGRSGGWLILKNNSNLITDPEDVIDDQISNLSDLTDYIDDEELKSWEEFRNIAGAGSRLLGRMGIKTGDFENIDDAENEANSAIATLGEELMSLEKLEEELNKVEERINTFWEDAEVNFDEFVKGEAEWRDESN